MAYQCWIRGCLYKADRLYGGDVPLCVLHDQPKVHRMLERGTEPVHCWSNNTPIIMPSASPLEYRPPREAPPDARYPHECPLLQEATPGNVFPEFDLLVDLS